MLEAGEGGGGGHGRTENRYLTGFLIFSSSPAQSLPAPAVDGTGRDCWLTEKIFHLECDDVMICHRVTPLHSAVDSASRENIWRIN